MNLSVSAERDPSQQMCEWLLRRTATYRRPSLREPFVVTCFTGSTFSRLICLLCGNDEKTSLRWSNTSSIIARGKWERTYGGQPKKASTCFAPTAGQGTSANCRT